MRARVARSPDIPDNGAGGTKRISNLFRFKGMTGGTYWESRCIHI